MIGIELTERVTPTLCACNARGVLALPAGTLTLRLLPPLVWERAQADKLIASLGAVMAWRRPATTPIRPGPAPPRSFPQRRCRSSP